MIDYIKLDKKSLDRFLAEIKRRNIPGIILCIDDGDMVDVTLDYPDGYKKDVNEVICSSVDYEIRK